MVPLHVFGISIVIYNYYYRFSLKDKFTTREKKMICKGVNKNIVGMEFNLILLFYQVFHTCYTNVSPSVQVDDPQLIWSQSVAGLHDSDNKESIL
ncbi:unnamed protein product [Trifolium pratense]|uniref:Uncharacterized protein n=1 Tax=Trifolium pratense TaxID=57577 RepID=A0ACB0MAB0_TRIPR|nr:unnamed protein product [Trifolium pratense]